MNISAQKNSIYALDSLSSKPNGVIISNSGWGLDFRQADKVSKINLTVSQPSGTSIFFAFNTGGQWFKLNTSGQAENISSSDPDYSVLSSKGNTPANLTALTNIPAFAGNLVRVAVGLEASADGYIPTAKISATASSSNVQNTFVEYSPVYELSSNAVIAEVPFTASTANGAGVTITGQITTPDGGLSEWLTPAQLSGAQAQSLQLKATYYVPSPGTGSASVSSVSPSYYSSGFAAAGGTGRIFSVTQDWYTPIKQARVNIRHSALGESAMNVYVTFRASPTQVIKESLGVSSSGKKTYQLAHKNGIRYDTFRLYADSQEISSYELNAEVGRVTCTVPEGSIMTASYEYGWDKETWHKMTLSSRNSLPDFDESEYNLEISDNNYSAAAFMIEVVTKTGYTNSATLGIATGAMQTFKLPHVATNIRSVSYGNATSNTGNIARSNFTLLNGARLLRTIAPAGSYVRTNYDWESDPVRIMQVTAVFSE